MFSEFVKEITKELEAKESRNRARDANAQIAFNYAVGYLLKQLWRDTLSYPPRESTINLRSGYYSELERYRDPQLTYRQVKAAFEALLGPLLGACWGPKRVLGEAPGSCWDQLGGILGQVGSLCLDLGPFEPPRGPQERPT